MPGPAPSSARQSPRPVKLLLLEDNPGDADLVRAHLDGIRWAEFSITHATTLEGALAGLRADCFDVLLVDLSLPDAEGIEVVQRIRSASPAAALVVLSGLDSEAVELEAVQTGAQDFVAKSRLGAELLSRTIRHGVERARLFSQLRSLVMRDADATLVVSNGGIIKFANPAAEQLLGRSAEHLVGEPFGHPIDGRPSVEIELDGPTGPRLGEMRAVETDWQGEVCHLASIRDITDRKRAAELERRLFQAERLASIGQLAAGVAHEVNNPAAFILANLSFVQEELAHLEELGAALQAPVSAAGLQPSAAGQLAAFRFEQRLQELGGIVRDSVAGTERIVKLVRELKNFARIEPAAVELVDLDEVVRQAATMTRNELRHRARLEIELGSLPRIAGDRSRLTQVFTNLLLNAAQAIEEGAADCNTIRVTSQVLPDTLVLSVTDTGTGIPEALQSKVFEPFFTTKKQGHGTGLGLSLSAEIIRKHGGRIRCVSPPGEGSTFEVSLPLAGPMTPLAVPALPKPSGPSAPRSRVLVIDDEPALLRTLHRMLARHHEVVTAEGGARGLEVLSRDRSFDVIFCDLMMPEVDGLAVFSHLKTAAPELLNRLVFCSGGVFTERVQSFLRATPNTLLDKPVSPEQLGSAIAAVRVRTSGGRTA